MCFLSTIDFAVTATITIAIDVAIYFARAIRNKKVLEELLLFGFTLLVMLL